MKIKIDTFVIAIVGVVILASFWPATSEAQVFLKHVSTWGIALLFFMHGAKLSSEAIVGGITNWRMHLIIVGLTFLLFPILGWSMQFIPQEILSPTLYSGFLFLSALPSTVNSSVVFTSSAKGNVAGAVCAASLSSLLGVFLSPFLVGVLMKAHGGGIDLMHTIKSILIELMLPFVLGHSMRKYILSYIEKNKSHLKIIDQGAILLVVYTAFSKAVSDGLWGKISGVDFVVVSIISMLMLGIVMGAAMFLSRKAGLGLADEVAVVFCGSKKSLVNGVPMANIMFEPSLVGILIIPLMIFHQIQLIVCVFLVNYFTEKAKNDK